MTNDSKVYVPAPARPPRFDQRIDAICGFTLSGQPKLRVVWGWNARCFRNGNPDALKYPNPALLNRWLIEQWVSASFYGTRQQWEDSRYFTDDTGKKTDMLGEYPYRGDYILVQPLLAPDGGYTPLDENVITFINMMRKDFESRTQNAFSGVQLKLQMEQMMARDQAILDAEAQKEIDDRKQWFKTNESKLNNEREFSKNLGKILWTPDNTAISVH